MAQATVNERLNFGINWNDAFVPKKLKASDVVTDGGVSLEQHVTDNDIHVTVIDKNRWDGKTTAYVFDTVEDMNTWLETTSNTDKLSTGDSLFIRDTKVPDYWWDGEQAVESEVAKVDLADYYTKSQVDTKLDGKAETVHTHTEYRTEAQVNTQIDAKVQVSAIYVTDENEIPSNMMNGGIVFMPDAE